ncbi:MAG: hypothetical protein H7259_10720, partial [Cytophagales bacterium]|nr:hypothetical protein [Cytophaga sp.]
SYNAPRGFFVGGLLYYYERNYSTETPAPAPNYYPNYYNQRHYSGFGTGVKAGYQFMTNSGITFELSAALIATHNRYVYTDGNIPNKTSTGGSVAGQFCIGMGYAFGK